MTDSRKHIVAIIPAAGKPTNRIVPNTALPDTMTPIAGKPVIGHILDDLMERKIESAVIILNKNDEYTEKYAKRMYGPRCELTFIYNDSPDRGVGYSIALAAGKSPRGAQFLVYLGDTIYKGKLAFDKNFVVASSAYTESGKWCFVETRKKKLVFINKPKEYKGRGKILCGLYFFTDGYALQKTLARFIQDRKKIELSDILSAYCATRKTAIIDARYWYDCGNIENYYKARIDFLKVRSFNSIRYNDTYGYITKTSKDTEKLADEIHWYKGTPAELKIFAPRMVGYSMTGKKAGYSTEFYGYQSLADMFVFESLDPKIWQSIIKKLFQTLALFKKYRHVLPYRKYRSMYYEKTLARLQKLAQKPYWKNLFEKETLRINGTEYKNINHFLPHIEKAVRKLYEKDTMSFIHGDFCLGNVLYDPSSKILKVIDPRGNFGGRSIYGDLKYDVAKMRHSFSGSYDFIVSDLFRLEEKNGDFRLEIFTSDQNKEAAAYFNKELVRNKFSLSAVSLIESLLFLSMIPLHADNPKRQLAMFLRGIMLINETKL